MTLSAVAPASVGATEQQNRQGYPAVDPAFEPREAELKTFFQACNNYIESELDRTGLRRHAGGRPRPIQMLGLGDEDSNSSSLQLSRGDLLAIERDVEHTRFLESTYDYGRVNAIHSYVTLTRQYPSIALPPIYVVEPKNDEEKARAEEWLVGKACAASCTPVGLEKARRAVHASYTSPQPQKYDRYEAADAINRQLRRANEELAKIYLMSRSDLTNEMLERYTEVWAEMVQMDGPLRFLAAPRIRDAVGLPQTKDSASFERILYHAWIPGKPVIPSRKSNQYGRAYWDGKTTNHQYKIDPYWLLEPHPYVMAYDFMQAVHDTMRTLEETMREQDVELAKAKKEDKRSIQAASAKLMGANSFAVHHALLDEKDGSLLKHSACRAFRDFALDRARSKQFQSNLTDTLVIGGGILTGGLSMYALITTHTIRRGAAYAVGAVVGYALIAQKIYIKKRDWRRAELNARAVLAGNESPDVILTRIPEQVRSANQSVALDVLLSGVGTYFIVDDIQAAFRVYHGLEASAALLPLDHLVSMDALKQAGPTGLKLLASIGKLFPAGRALYLNRRWEDHVGDVMLLKEDGSSGIVLTVEVSDRDIPRDFVSLRVKKRTGPNGEDLSPDRQYIHYSVATFDKILKEWLNTKEAAEKAKQASAPVAVAPGRPRQSAK